MKAVVVKAYARPYADPISVAAGESVTPDFARHTDIAGWVWCTAMDGRSGWTPRNWLALTDGAWRIDRAFNAIELTIAPGEVLDLAFEESGFFWATKQDGESGWVPCGNVSVTGEREEQTSMSKEGTESFRIRPATVEDSTGIARLAGELGYPATAAEMALRLAAMLPLPNHFVAIADGSDSLLGWVAVERRLLLISGDKAELMGLVIGSAARRAGVGKALVSAAERWVIAQGLDTIVVRSNVARAESHPFYERLGYTRTKTQHAYVKMLSTASNAPE